MIKCLDVLRNVYDETKDRSSMVTPLQIGAQLVDWTDPQKAMCVARPLGSSARARPSEADVLPVGHRAGTSTASSPTRACRSTSPSRWSRRCTGPRRVRPRSPSFSPLDDQVTDAVPRLSLCARRGRSQAVVPATAQAVRPRRGRRPVGQGAPGSHRRAQGRASLSLSRCRAPSPSSPH